MIIKIWWRQARVTLTWVTRMSPMVNMNHFNQFAPGILLVFLNHCTGLFRLYKFLAGTSKAQIFDKGMRQKSTKRVNSFIACGAFCPRPPNRDPRDSEKRWHVYTSIAMMAHHAWRVYKSSGKTHKNRNAYIDAHRSAIPTKICGFIRHPMRTG